MKSLWTQHATLPSMFLKQVLPLSVLFSVLEGLTFAVRPSDHSNLTLRAFTFCGVEFGARFLRLTGSLYLDIILLKPEISKYSAHLSICFCLRGLKQNGKKSSFLWIQEELHNLILIAIRTSILTKSGIFIM